MHVNHVGHFTHDWQTNGLTDVIAISHPCMSCCL